MIEFRKATVTEHGKWITLPADTNWNDVQTVDNNTGMFHYRIRGEVYKRVTTEFKEAFHKERMWEQLSEPV